MELLFVCKILILAKKNTDQWMVDGRNGSSMVDMMHPGLVIHCTPKDSDFSFLQLRNHCPLTQVSVADLDIVVSHRLSQSKEPIAWLGGMEAGPYTGRYRICGYIV